MIKKVLLAIISIVLVYIFTVPILKGGYWVIAHLTNSFTFSNPVVVMAKYLVPPIIVLFLILKFWNVTSFGKVFLRAGILLLFLAFLCIIVWVNTTDAEKIVQQRLWQREAKTWSEVKYIQTKAAVSSNHEILGIEYRERSRRGKTIPNITLEYRIYFKDGSSVNVWDDTESVYRLHKFITKKGIMVRHEVVKKNMLNSLEYYVDGDTSKFIEILGVNEHN